eukprot:m.236722 g.236722  ORF g.236722 m.236722 type:complete len:467 (+) comp19353_c0_seq2:282-1682(+)
MPKDAKNGKKGKKPKGHDAAKTQLHEDGNTAARFDMLAAQMSQLRAKGLPTDDQEESETFRPAVSSTIADPDAETYLPDDIEDNEATLAFLDQAVASGYDSDDSIASSSSRASRAGKKRTSGSATRAGTSAYRFTALLHKLQKWRVLTTRAVLELDKKLHLPPQSSDPEWVSRTLDTCWVDAKRDLEEMMKGAANIASVIQYGLNSGQAASMTDYGSVELQMVRVLKHMAPLVKTFRLAAVLDETPGIEKTLVRKCKSVCHAVAALMSALEKSGGSPDVVQQEVTDGVRGVDSGCKALLKYANKGTEEARMAVVHERQRAHRTKQLQEQKAFDAKLQQVRSEREEAERLLEMAQEICDRDKVNMEEAIAKARKEEEARVIAEATVGRGVLFRERILPPDLSTDGFQESEEGMYDTTPGQMQREGFTTDGRELVAKQNEIERQKEAYIARLKMKMQQAAEDDEEDDI